MPKVYRAMRKEADDKPLVDASGKGLGVRIEPVNDVVDVELDAQGNVRLNGKGMSVAPSWRVLPPFLIPKRLRDKCPEARGSSQLFCFSLGEGLFENGPIASGLNLYKDSEIHGNIVPAQRVSAAQFQAALAMTRSSWQIDEG
jgi:hypothetical protein